MSSFLSNFFNVTQFPFITDLVSAVLCIVIVTCCYSMLCSALSSGFNNYH